MPLWAQLQLSQSAVLDVILDVSELLPEVPDAVHQGVYRAGPPSNMAGIKVAYTFSTDSAISTRP